MQPFYIVALQVNTVQMENDVELLMCSLIRLPLIHHCDFPIFMYILESLEDAATLRRLSFIGMYDFGGRGVVIPWRTGF